MSGLLNLLLSLGFLLYHQNLAHADCGIPEITKFTLIVPLKLQYKNGDVINYHCTDDNAILIGEGTRICEKNNKFSGVPPTCGEFCIY